MARVLVLYYSSYGHIEAMANAIADGARAEGAAVDVMRVPETVPEEIALNAHFKLDQPRTCASVKSPGAHHPPLAEGETQQASLMIRPPGDARWP